MSRGAVFGLACVATLVVCPVARACYYLLFLPAGALISLRFLQLGRPRSAQFVAWLPFALVWLHYLLLPAGGRIGLLGLGTTAWFLATSMLLDRRVTERSGLWFRRRPAYLTPKTEPEALVAAM